MRQGLSPDLQQRKREITERYGDRGKFLATMNPDLQQKAAQDAERCILGDAPTLVSINIAYGSATAKMWLIPQLVNLSEYCGVRDKLTERQLEECAGVIATEYYFLKVSELLLFFHRYKAGRYGKMYGAVDPLAITTALREFVAERNRVLSRHEQESHTRHDPEAIDINEYERRYGRLRPVLHEVMQR